MLICCALVAVGMGLIIGRLYPAVSLLIVSPLFGLVAAFAAASDGRSLWHAVLFGGVAIFLFQLSYLGGVRLRWSVKRSGVAEPVASPPAAADAGTLLRVDRSR